MGILTEPEIFECLVANFRGAAEDCDLLAVSPRKGPAYRRLCERLELIIGACRQAAYWRQDTRWLEIEAYMKEAHVRAGHWLRGVKLPDGQRVVYAAAHQYPLFRKLAEKLRDGLRKAEEFRDKATGRVGIILPELLPAPTRTEGRQVQVMLPSSMLVPQEVTFQ